MEILVDNLVLRLAEVRGRFLTSIEITGRLEVCYAEFCALLSDADCLEEDIFCAGSASLCAFSCCPHCFPELTVLDSHIS
jgi:hypothetical protein